MNTLKIRLTCTFFIFAFTSGYAYSDVHEEQETPDPLERSVSLEKPRPKSGIKFDTEKNLKDGDQAQQQPDPLLDNKNYRNKGKSAKAAINLESEEIKKVKNSQKNKSDKMSKTKSRVKANERKISADDLETPDPLLDSM